MNISLTLISLSLSLFCCLNAAKAQNNSIDTKTIDITYDNSDEAKDFIVFGLIDHSNSKEILDFREKYGVGYKFENCVIDPFSYSKAKKNNNKLIETLNEKYGFDWKNDIPYPIVGINSQEIEND